MKEKVNTAQGKSETKKCCGLIMPISSLGDCSEQHWTEVKDILTEAIESAGLEAKLVSHSDDSGIIQKRIIHNLYENPIVVCDVSGKNPNVMFELGMRLAFDKPTIIIKDDKTSYSFDTSPIEHLEYPRDLRFGKINEFKDGLRDKLLATIKKAESDPTYTTFLKHFGTFTVAKLETKEVSKEDFIIEELRDIRKSIQHQEIARLDKDLYGKFKIPKKLELKTSTTNKVNQFNLLRNSILKNTIKLYENKAVDFKSNKIKREIEQAVFEEVKVSEFDGPFDFLEGFEAIYEQLLISSDT